MVNYDDWRSKKSGNVTFRVEGKAYKMMNDVHRTFHVNKSEQMVVILKKFFPQNYHDYLELMREPILNQTQKKFEQMQQENFFLEKEIKRREEEFFGKMTKTDKPSKG